ncbi:MAG: hypothetical protein FJ225_04135 [Lentisphaerae bacterium]|nr:hypothetical protein [Lentisphaerota bacterium]
MESAGPSVVLKLLLALFLSVQDGPRDTGQRRNVESLAPAGAVGCVALDVAQLRALIREDPELAKALFAGRTAEASYGESIEALGQLTSVDPAALRESIARVRAVKLWSMGMGRRGEPRFLAVFDRGDAPDILPRLFGARMADGAGASRAMIYAGRMLHAVGPDPGDAVWFAEANGLLAVASDSLTAETFILKAGAEAGASVNPVSALPPLLEVRADIGAVVNGFLPAMSRGDMAEFLAAGAFVDLPAWRGATLRMTRDGIALRAEIDPGSPLAAALKPPERVPALADAIPADAGLALAVGVRDAAQVWDLFEAGFSHMAIAGRGESPREEFLRDVARGTGLDVRADLVSNLVAAAVVVIDPAHGRKLERHAALLLEGKDPARAQATVRALVTQAEKEGEVAAENRPGVQVWRTDDVVIALKGNVLLVAPSRGDGQAAAERMLKHFAEGGEGLGQTPAARQAGATAFATADASRLFPQAGLERITAGLTADARSVTVRLDGGGRNLAAGMLRLMFDAGQGATARAAEARTMSALRQVALACQMYAMDHAKLPVEIEDLKPYAGNLDAIQRDMGTGQAIRLNPAVAGRAPESVKQPGATVLVYAPPDRDGQNICAAFCDGSVRLLTPAQLETALISTPRTE